MSNAQNPEFGKSEKGVKDAATAILGKLQGLNLDNIQAITIGLQLRGQPGSPADEAAEQEQEAPTPDAENKADEKVDAEAVKKDQLPPKYDAQTGKKL